MAGLTEKNKRAIDLYLSADEEFQGNGTKCWQKVYGTKNARSASTAFQRMLTNVDLHQEKAKSAIQTAQESHRGIRPRECTGRRSTGSWRRSST